MASFALTAALIVFNKVGSPQFMTWLVAPIVLGLVLDRRRWRSVAVFALVVAALTQSVYPLTYDGLLLAAPPICGVHMYTAGQVGRGVMQSA